MSEAIALDSSIQTGVDIRLRGGTLIARWLLLLLYFVFVSTGVLDVSQRDLLWSAGFIFVYDVFHLYLFFRNDEAPWFHLTRHADIVTVTVVLISLQDLRSAVWAIYFISIVALARMLSRRDTALYVGWVTANYAGAAGVVWLMGHDVPWAYVTVVACLLQFMGFFAGLLAGAEERIRAVIAHAAATDSLTGLANRHAFHEQYTAIFDEAGQRRSAIAVMLLDVDHFKEINDTHGHPAGDDKLREVAASLQSVVRGTDLVARYGGDEFVVVAPQTTRDAALRLAERLREAAAECQATLSIGVACFPEDAQAQDTLIEAADRALYRAKQAGRNCVRDLLAAA